MHNINTLGGEWYVAKRKNVFLRTIFSYKRKWLENTTDRENSLTLRVKYL